MGDATAARWVTREEWLSREGVVSEPRGPRPVGCWRRSRRSEGPGCRAGSAASWAAAGPAGSLRFPPWARAALRASKKSQGDQWAGGCGVRWWEILENSVGVGGGSQTETELVFSPYSVGERGAGNRGTHGERQAQEGPKAANDLLQLSAGCPTAPFPESPVSGLARTRRASSTAGPHTNTG